MIEQWHVTVALFGALIGSFLNVCIYRLPAGESLVRPGSRCPHCKTPIAWHDNVPILSYLWLRGRCRKCRALIAWRFGGTAVTYVYCLLFSALVVVSFIDLDHMIVPDRITLPGMALGLVVGTLLLPRWWDSIGGLALGGGMLYFMAWISPYLFGKEGMGGGDIKLLAMIGAFLGWQQVLLTVIVGGIVGAGVGVALIGARIMTRGAYIPFGPFLSLGAVVAMLYGAEILGWYGTFLSDRR